MPHPPRNCTHNDSSLDGAKGLSSQPRNYIASSMPLDACSLAAADRTSASHRTQFRIARAIALNLTRQHRPHRRRTWTASRHPPRNCTDAHTSPPTRPQLLTDPNSFTSMVHQWSIAPAGLTTAAYKPQYRTPTLLDPHSPVAVDRRLLFVGTQLHPSRCCIYVQSSPSNSPPRHANAEKVSTVKLLPCSLAKANLTVAPSKLQYLFSHGITLTRTRHLCPDLRRTRNAVPHAQCYSAPLYFSLPAGLPPLVSVLHP